MKYSAIFDILKRFTESDFEAAFTAAAEEWLDECLGSNDSDFREVIVGNEELSFRYRDFSDAERFEVLQDDIVISWNDNPKDFSKSGGFVFYSLYG